MFYTKYRPQRFSEIVQPNSAASALMKQLSTKKNVHAYLFVGPRGTGKTTIARILAKSLNCTKLLKNGDPCAKCASCDAIKNGAFVDLIEIDAASNRGIDDIRDLKDKVNLSPASGDTKVYIIDEVHMLTKEAFNALLKTLEEPPSHAVFILCTTEVHKVPDTIKSRCQVFKFKRASIKQIVEKLEFICKEEGIGKDIVKKEDLKKIAQASFGGFRDAETMFQQVVEGGIDVVSLVGLSSKDIYVSFVDALVAKDTSTALHSVNKLVEDGLDLSVWVLDLLTYLRELLFVHADAFEGILDVSDEVLVSMKSQASSLTPSYLIELIEAFILAGNQVAQSPIPQLPLELAIVKLCGDDLQNKGVSKPSKSPSAPKITEISEDIEDVAGVVEESSEESSPEELSDFSEESFPEELHESSEDISEKADRAIVDIDIIKIQEKWPQIVKATVEHNNSLHVLLNSGSPIAVVSNELILEVAYKFHKDRLETPKSRSIIESVFKDVLGQDVGLQCRVNVATRPKRLDEGETGELTDKNVAVPAATAPTNILDFFDGGLPA